MNLDIGQRFRVRVCDLGSLMLLCIHDSSSCALRRVPTSLLVQLSYRTTRTTHSGYRTAERSDLDLSCQVKYKISSLFAIQMNERSLADHGQTRMMLERNPLFLAGCRIVQPDEMAQDKDIFLRTKLWDEMERLIVEAGFQTPQNLK
eukprot:scaffold49463_cov47-Attheya_sp.AAC.3